MQVRMARVGLGALGLALLMAASVAGAREVSKIQGELENTGAQPAAEGRVRSTFLEARSGLSLRVSNLVPLMTYKVVVGGVPEDTFTTSSSGRASLRYQTPAGSSSSRPLDFDPRGKTIEITDDSQTVLEATTAGAGQSDGLRTDERVELTSTALAPAGAARARFRTDRDGRQRFSIEVQDAPAGTYDVFVDGVARGSFAVDASTRGEIEFSTEPENAELPLDFDPRGLTVDLLLGGQVAFSGVMEAQAQGVTTCQFAETEVAIASTGADADGSAKARLRTRSDCDRDFEVEIEDVPVGSYDLLVGGVLRGVITVADNGVEVEGEIEFETEADDPNELLLSFDPEGQTIAIVQGATTFFSSVFAAAAGAPGSSACETLEVELPLLNSGAAPAASGKARFRVRDDCDRDFRVEIEDLALGNYDLLVDGVLRATIAVVNTGFEVEGEAEFDSDPNEPGELLLNFDPRGKLIEIMQGATLFLSRTFDEGSGGGSGPGSCTEEETRLDLVNVGPISQADGEARFRVRDDCDEDFRVQIEDVPDGSYNLIVGGTLRGSITVALGQGELEFDTEPNDPGELLLVFDPRGQLIEIEQGGTIFLNLQFP